MAFSCGFLSRLNFFHFCLPKSYPSFKSILFSLKLVPSKSRALLRTLFSRWAIRHPAQPWVSVCVHKDCWGFLQIWGLLQRPARLRPHSPTKGRRLDSTRPDGPGGSPGTDKEATTVQRRWGAVGSIGPPHKAWGSNSLGFPLGIPSRVGLGERRGHVLGGRGLHRARERGGHRRRVHSRRPRAARSVLVWRRRRLEAGLPARRRGPVERQQPRSHKLRPVGPGLVSPGCLWRGSRPWLRQTPTWRLRDRKPSSSWHEPRCAGALGAQGWGRRAWRGAGLSGSGGRSWGWGRRRKRRVCAEDPEVRGAGAGWWDVSVGREDGESTVCSSGLSTLLPPPEGVDSDFNLHLQWLPQNL